MTLHRRPHGFTLIELLVVLAVVALLAAGAVPALRGVTGADARQAAGELAGSLRYLFDTAALRHATCRMAIDLEGRAWWAECAPGAAAISRDPEKQPTDAELEERFPDEKDADRRRLLAATKFGAFKDKLLDRHELPGGAAFGEVRVEGRAVPATAGMAYVHFFPGGQAQRAFLPVADGDYLYTVVLEPFTGRAVVVSGKVEDR